MYKFLCWNIRGLNDLGKKVAVKEVVMAQGLHLVCLQETKMEVFSSHDLRMIGGNRLSAFEAKATVGASGEFSGDRSGLVFMGRMETINVKSYGKDSVLSRVIGIIRGVLWLLQRSQFRELVETNWAIAIPRLQGPRKVAFKLKRLKFLLKRWNTEQRRARRARKSGIGSEVDMLLDRREEVAALSVAEREQRLQGETRMFLEGLADAEDVPSYVAAHPFGQPAITATDPNWYFYSQIIHSFSNDH
ncbi:hypothetical protein QJS10_CPA08g00522 [Acorus calamus]|uniref:Reverse transcriptase n=1 Tax=Acorus calamus TaxID=4465 RepID=A0AAV9EBT2_ACOCL|nr:hypothetical protein QJS10_CPA08g00522 [Acorus calamus]